MLDILGKAKAGLENKLSFLNAFDPSIEMTWLRFGVKFLVTCSSTAGLFLFVMYRLDDGFGAVDLFSNDNFMSMFSDGINKLFTLFVVVFVAIILAFLDYLATVPFFLFFRIKKYPSILRMMLCYSISFQLIYFFGAVFFATSIMVKTYGESVHALAVIAILVATMISGLGLEFIGKKRLEYMRGLFESESERKKYLIAKGVLIGVSLLTLWVTTIR